jgi:cell division protein FtsB
MANQAAAIVITALRANAELQTENATLRHENDQLREQVSKLHEKAMMYDLDRAGIEDRTRDLAELVDLRAEVVELNKKIATATRIIHKLWAKKGANNV